MRTNLPVTQREYEFPQGETLVSTTDLKSRITYCNHAFVRVSGYAQHELIGELHNMIRHPDMPREAFRDMWDTIESGQPWSALVKNRRKDGDHYWVVANVTPILGNDGRPTGYMSVRTKPTRQQVQEAEALYAQMRNEEQSGGLSMKLHRGRLLRVGWRGAVQRALQMSMHKRLVNALGLCVLLPLACTLLPLGASTLPWIQLGVGLLTAAAVLAWLSTTVAQPMREAADLANRMAAGDLTVRVDATRPDEIGQVLRALNQVNVNLQAVVGDVRREVEGVETASQQIAAGNSDLSARTESQASSLQQTAASMEELNATVQQNTQTAQSARDTATRASTVAEQGGQEVGHLISTMGEIESASKKISDIIGVIDGIAFQTNILALLIRP